MSDPLRPLAFNPYRFLSFADQTMANRSPPMLVMCGSTTGEHRRRQ
jgi:hypothetical protein